MDEFFIQSGYLGLFLSAFLASTLLPLSSEVVVAIMTTAGYNIPLILIIATLGNYLGASTNYFVGKYGNQFIFSRYIKVDPNKERHAKKIYKKFGAPSLFFSWLPVIGDLLCIVPGALHLNFFVFSFWVILGKAFRYVIIIMSAEYIIMQLV